MSDHNDQSDLAPKIFFIDPDPFLITDLFLETCFRLGYEAYSFPLERSGDPRFFIEALVDTFQDLILFFTVDRWGTIPECVDYLSSLQRRHGTKVRIGVLYSRTQDSVLPRRLESAFLMDAGVTAGCVALPLATRKGQDLVLNVLSANQAAGRRKRIRILCHPPFGVNFLTAEGSRDVRLVDLSISHFTVELKEPDPAWELGAKVTRIQLRLGGRLLLVNALVALKRIVSPAVLYVFLFHPEATTPGLEDLMQTKVNQIIREQYTSRTEALLEARANLAI